MYRHYLVLVFLLIAVFPSFAQDSSLPKGYQPCPVEQLSGAWIEGTKLHDVKLSFVTSHEMVNMSNWKNSPMDAKITKVEISRSKNMVDYQLVGTIDNPNDGYNEYVDKELKYGTYYYKVRSYAGEVGDWGIQTEVVVGQLPAELESDAVKISVPSIDSRDVTFSFTIPTISTVGATMKMPITKLEIGEMDLKTYVPSPYYTETAKEKLVPGSKIEYTLEGASTGLHMFTIQMFTEVGGAAISSFNFFVGKDQPGRVQNIEVVEVDGGLKVSWDAPVVGYNGGDFGDVGELLYTVRRGYGDSDENAYIVADSIKDLSVVEILNFDEELKFEYIVTAFNEKGASIPVATEPIVYGPSATLPYYEGFDRKTDKWGNTSFEHNNWLYDFSAYYCVWQLGQQAYVHNSNVSPNNGPGFIYAFYNNWGETHHWDAITSGHIDFTGVDHPLLTFYIYDLNHGGSDVKFTVQAGNEDEGFTDVLSFQMGSSETDGWRQVSVEIPQLVGNPRGQIRFVTTPDGSDCFTVAIDGISIVNKSANAIENIENESSSDVIYNLQGQRLDKMSQGLNIVNGKKIIVR